MSEIEKKELMDRIKGMSGEELCMIVSLCPDEMLWSELRKRDAARIAKLSQISDLIKEDI